jgi:F-type H+-transporting ATPase subunit O
MLEESVQGRYAGVLFTTASHREALHSVLEDVRYLKDLAANVRIMT